MGKAKKRDRQRNDVLSLEGCAAAAAEPEHEDPRKIARLSQASPAARAERAGVNLVEVDGKTCTHEVAWPPPREDADPAMPSGAWPFHAHSDGAS